MTERKTLTIVLPALNEEEAIGGTLESVLTAIPAIRRQADLEAVEVIVVNDGSTDRTPEIVEGYSGIQLINFPVNRGYGAAIKAGFEAAEGGLLGFMDADGTCDPAFFGTLCRVLQESGADMALGSRMGPESRMPAVRRLGNRAYAVLLSILSNRPVTDTASGMRVLGRAAYEKVKPLPDGLQFTPAMTARVLMDPTLDLVEAPMPYHERVGRSKLSVLRDGVRFLKTIGEMVLFWSPGRCFLGAGVGLALLVMLLGLHPMESWLRNGRLEEGMIYRLLFCHAVGVVSISLLSARTILQRLDFGLGGGPRSPSFVDTLLDRVHTLPVVFGLSLFFLPLVLWLVGPGWMSRLADGVVRIHWSRVVAASLIVLGLVQVTIATLVLNVVRYHAERGVRIIQAARRAATEIEKRVLEKPEAFQEVDLVSVGRGRPTDRENRSEDVTRAFRML